MPLEETVLSILRAAEMPLKTAEITKQARISAGKAASAKALAATLEALVSSGQVSRFQAGAQWLHTTQDAEAAAKMLLRRLIQAAKKEQPAAKLRVKLPPALQPHFEAALAALVNAGEAFVLPGARRLVHARRPRPSDLLGAAQRKALLKIFEGVNPVRGQPATLELFFTWLDEPAAPAATAGSGTVLEPDEEQLRVWHEQDRLSSSTLMIPLARTFARYAAWSAESGGAADSQLLRNLIERLYNDGRVLLEPCERPQDLPEDERALLVPMSIGPPGHSWCWAV